MAVNALVVRNGSIYIDSGTGIFTDSDIVAGVTADSSVELSAVVSLPSYVPGDTESMTLTPVGRLRVDTRPADETVNVFAASSPFDGESWSSKSPW